MRGDTPRFLRASFAAGVKHGDEARLDVNGFSLEGPRMESLRISHARATRERLQLKIIPTADLPLWLTSLQAISGEWLNVRRHVEKSFSLGGSVPTTCVISTRRSLWR